jgi:hypothetical protein
MKKVAILLAFLAASILCFSQKLVIDIHESQTRYSYSSSKNISEILSASSLVSTDLVNNRYIIDMQENTVSFYKNGRHVGNLPVNILKISTTQIQVQILEQGFDYGLIVDTDPNHEAVSLYVFYESLTELEVMTRFQIIKPS